MLVKPGSIPPDPFGNITGKVRMNPPRGLRGPILQNQNCSLPRSSICRLAAPSTMLLIFPTLPGVEMFAAGK